MRSPRSRLRVSHRPVLNPKRAQPGGFLEEVATKERRKPCVYHGIAMKWGSGLLSLILL